VTETVKLQITVCTAQSSTLVHIKYFVHQAAKINSFD